MACMNATGTIEKYATCVSLDVLALHLSGTRTAITDVLACRARLDHVLARLSTHADVLASSPSPEGPGGEQLLRRAQLTNHGASVIASRSRLLSVLPAFADALADGSIHAEHAEHVDALVPIVRDIDPQKLSEFTDPSIIDGLLAIARQSTPKELAKEARSVAAVVDIRLGETEAERIHRQRRVRFVRHRDGTTSVTGHLGAHRSHRCSPGSTLAPVDEYEEIDDLEAEIAAAEHERPGTRRRIEELSEVIRSTTRLWQAREHLGISIEEAAARSGLTIDQVELVEDNAVDCPFDVLSRYGKAVGMTFDLRPVSAT